MCRTGLVFLLLAVGAGIFSALYVGLGPVFEVSGVMLGGAAACATAIGYRRAASRRHMLPVRVVASARAVRSPR